MAEALGYREPAPALEAAAAAEGLVLGRAALDPQDVPVSRRHALLGARGGQLWLQDIP
jgi:hypothetical protein